MKKKGKIVIVFLLAGLFLVVVYQIARKNSYKQDVAKMIQCIPDFKLQSISNSIFTQDSLGHNSPTVFLYFSTDCDFCQYEIKKIKTQINEFNNVSLIFISPEPIEDIAKFADENDLSAKKNIIFLQDPVLSFASQFDANIIPYIIIYNKNRKLIKRFKGVMKVEEILKILSDER